MNSSEPQRSQLPSLPILNNPQVPARSQSEKYGSLFYLGILGLVIVIALVSWFGYRAWTLRDVWARIYVLNDAPARGPPGAGRLCAEPRSAR